MLCTGRMQSTSRKGNTPGELFRTLSPSGRLRPLSGFAFVRNIAPGTPFRYEVISGDCLR